MITVPSISENEEQMTRTILMPQQDILTTLAAYRHS